MSEAFTLSIKLDNGPLTESKEIAEALIRAAEQVVGTGAWDGLIKNDHGARVGSYALTDEIPAIKGSDSTPIRAHEVEVGMRMRTRNGKGFHTVRSVASGKMQGKLLLEVNWGGSCELRPDTVVYVETNADGEIALTR